MRQTDSELLEAFKRMHPTYTARTLQGILCVKRSMAFRVLRESRLEDYQRRLLRLYLELPEREREKHFS